MRKTVFGLISLIVAAGTIAFTRCDVEQLANFLKDTKTSPSKSGQAGTTIARDENSSALRFLEVFLGIGTIGGVLAGEEHPRRRNQ